MIKSFDVPQSNSLRELQLNAHSYMKFSNNVSVLNVVSTLQNMQSTGLVGGGSIDKSQLTRFTAGSNIKVIAPSCFIDCYNLEEVTFRGKLDIIDNYAFYGCTSLKTVNMVDASHTANGIGDYAFARTGLQNAKFGVKNTTSRDMFMGQCTFADCVDLTSFEFAGSNTMAIQMFKGCTSLSSVTFAKTTNSIQPGVFNGCAALKRLQMPSDTYAVPDDFANGCYSLTSFSFIEPGKLSYSQSLGNRILCDSAITSITFPASLTSFDAFSPYTLQGMNSLAEIHFNGMTYNQIATASTVVQPDVTPPPSVTPPVVQIEYDTTKIYYEDSLDGLLDYCGITADEKSSMFIKKSVTELCQIIKNCLDGSIPMNVFISSSKTNPPCGHCKNFFKTEVKNDAFKSFLQSNYKCVMICGSALSHANFSYGGAYSSFWSLGGYGQTLGWVAQSLLWKKPDGTLLRERYENIPLKQGVLLVIQRINNFVPDTAAGIDSGAYMATVTVTEVNQTITSTGCFGLNHSVKLFSNDGKCVEYTTDSYSFGSYMGMGSISYNTTVQVDRLTVDDFKYGQWYSKAKDLKNYADSNFIPVLAIASQGNGYKQSQAFNNTVFNNSSFQQYMTSKSILLCKIDSYSYSSGDPSFLLRTWMQKSSFKQLPLIMMYWVDKDGGIIIPDGSNPSSIQYVNDSLTDFAYFSDLQSAGKIDDATCVHSVDELITWIESLSVYKNYVPQARFDRPVISNFLSIYPRYKRYDNQVNDNYGRYFPVANLKAPSSSSYPVIVYNASGVQTSYLIYPSAPAASLPPLGTYQCFLVPQTDDNINYYDSIYESYGVLFKVTNEGYPYNVRSNFYSYYAMPYSTYLNSIGVTTAKIQSIQFDFNDDMYLDDASGNPTTNIDPEYFDAGQFWWNDFCMITLNPNTYVDSKNSYAVYLWLSSQAQILTSPADEYDDADSYVAPGNVEYVISAQVRGISTIATHLAWAREFTNS